MKHEHGHQTRHDTDTLIHQIICENHKIECNDKIATQQSCSNIDLEKLTFFQFMIGNLDWSIPHRHNIKLIVNENGSLPIPVPYECSHMQKLLKVIILQLDPLHLHLPGGILMIC